MTILFDYDFLMNLAQSNNRAYARAAPFPHITINQVGNSWLTDQCSKRFPPRNDPRWFTYPNDDRAQRNKQVLWDVTKMPQEVARAVAALNSAHFIHFLEILTAIPHLISDPFLYGGGMHQIGSDGTLEVHVDCDFNPRVMLYRRVTVLWYLSYWHPEYEGNLEFWEGASHNGQEHLTGRVKSIVPDFNRMVIFTNTETSYHGHPKAIRCPQDVTRKSLATYYFSSEPDSSYSKSRHHKARFVPYQEPSSTLR
jgi:2-oxoglutarate-Fe(II)-dependent oxygenase superfamily protein